MLNNLVVRYVQCFSKGVAALHLSFTDFTGFIPKWKLKVNFCFKTTTPHNDKLAQISWAALGRVLVVANLYYYMNNGGNCAHWDRQCCRNVSVPQWNLVSEVYRQVLGLYGFVCALTYSVNYGTIYRQVCAFPNHVQLNQVLETSDRWSVERGSSWAQLWVSSQKVVNTFVQFSIN